MRFNDHELIKVACGTPNMEGTLQYMKPQGNDWSDWYQQSVFKERTFKLFNNLLFYFRPNDLSEPLGLMVLENMQVAYENTVYGPAFSFSLTFTDGKHIFGCRCQEDANKWVTALKTASYNYWRSTYMILLTQIASKTGKEPSTFIRNKQNQEIRTHEVITTRTSRSTFYSAHTERTTTRTINKPPENLIDL